MRHLTVFSLVVLSACQPLTDPCFEADNYDGPPKCVGQVTANLDAEPPEFSVEGTSNVTPNEFSFGIADGDPCEGSTTIWEVSRLNDEDYPIAYGVQPERTREWVNDQLTTDGQLPALIDGNTYVVSFNAGDRLGSGATANTAWTGAFIAGDPTSFHLLDDRCF